MSALRARITGSWASIVLSVLALVVVASGAELMNVLGVCMWALALALAVRSRRRDGGAMPWVAFGTALLVALVATVVPMVAVLVAAA